MRGVLLFLMLFLSLFLITGCGGGSDSGEAESCKAWEVYDFDTESCRVLSGRCNGDSDCSGGDRCNITQHRCEDGCLSTTCGANELCSIQNSTPICGCKEGYLREGDLCVEPGICHNESCDNHGVCNEELQRCECNTGYDNPADNPLSCVTDHCFGESCGGNGTCMMDGAGAPFCDCNEGYVQKDRMSCVASGGSPCEGVDCGGNGVCSIVNSEAVCSCHSGFESREDPLICVDICSGITCSDLGSCSVVENAPLCDCNDGYFPVNGGIECGNPCLGRNCSGHGTCQVKEGEAVCSCETGYINYKGDCIEQCDSLTCPENGFCFKEDTLEYCACEAGFVGVGSECVAATWGAVGTGYDHGCGTFGGQLYCWGDNSRGETGIFNIEFAKRPRRVERTTGWDFLTGGDRLNCGMRGDRAFCWGRNEYGQLGLGKGYFSEQIAPGEVSLSGDWETISAGDEHVCGIRQKRLYCWGRNNVEQLGGSGESAYDEPEQKWNLKMSEPQQILWESISAGSRHTCGINNGYLYCWGDTTHRQTKAILTNGETFHSNILVSNYHGWSAISCGDTHSCGILEDKLYCWGTSLEGALGLGTENEAACYGGVVNTKCYGVIADIERWSSVSAGKTHTCGISEGKLYCWGDNQYGQLGIGSLENQFRPVQIGSSSNWSAVSTGAHFTCGIKNSELYCWGKNDTFQLASGVGDAVTTPQRIMTILQ